MVSKEDYTVIKEMALNNIPLVKIGWKYNVHKKIIRRIIFGHYLKPREKIYMNQNGICNGCKEHIPFRKSTVDHIIPRSKGGITNKDNIQMLCRSCNGIKANHDMDFLYRMLNKK